MKIVYYSSRRGLKENNNKKKKKKYQLEWRNLKEILKDFRASIFVYNKTLFLLFRKLLNRVDRKLLINDLILREHKLAVARFENCKLDPRRIATIKSRRYGGRTLKYYVWPICLV